MGGKSLTALFQVQQQFTYKCLFSKYGHPLMTCPNQVRQRSVLLPRLMFTKIIFKASEIFKDPPHPITYEDTVTIRPASICPMEPPFCLPLREHPLDFL